MSNISDSIHSVTPDRLARLLGGDEGPERLWDMGELGAILRHQLTAPIAFDLGKLTRNGAQRLKALAASESLLLRTFHDLFSHECPPIELLQLTKDFTKACQASPNAPIPREVARVLYYACIAAALVRLNRRITTLPDAEIAKGLSRLLDGGWLDEDTRRLFEEARDMLGPTETERISDEGQMHG